MISGNEDGVPLNDNEEIDGAPLSDNEDLDGIKYLKSFFFIVNAYDEFIIN